MVLDANFCNCSLSIEQNEYSTNGGEAAKSPSLMIGQSLECRYYMLATEVLYTEELFHPSNSHRDLPRHPFCICFVVLRLLPYYNIIYLMSFERHQNLEEKMSVSKFAPKPARGQSRNICVPKKIEPLSPKILWYKSREG